MAMDGRMYPGRVLPLGWPSMPECITVLSIAFELCAVSSGVFLSFSPVLFMTSIDLGGFLRFSRCTVVIGCHLTTYLRFLLQQWRESPIFFSGTVHPKGTTYRPWRFTISTSCAESLFLSFCMLFSRKISFNAFSSRTASLEETIAAEVKWRSTFNKSLLSRASALVTHFFWIVSCAVVEWTHSNDEKRRSRVRYYFCLLNGCVKKQFKGRKLFFVFLQFVNFNMFKEGLRTSLRQNLVEIVRLLVVFDELDSDLIDEHDIILRRHIEGGAINMNDFESLF